ncbi:hypothetical protein [Acidipila sp. EB88]|uniref:hypothetical protein n=1 Tax=Acidipila sp. EB88 TaxID=2305226 RepID=UPI000F5FF14A|nr:hypothetical protein [Acidipila sp. EB88]
MWFFWQALQCLPVQQSIITVSITTNAKNDVAAKARLMPGFCFLQDQPFPDERVDDEPGLARPLTPAG